MFLLSPKVELMLVGKNLYIAGKIPYLENKGVFN